MAVSLGFETFYGYLVSTLSYRVVAICLLSVPVTHVAGLLAAGNGASGLKLHHGGNRFKLLACCSYVSAAWTATTGSLMCTKVVVWQQQVCHALDSICSTSSPCVHRLVKQHQTNSRPVIDMNALQRVWQLTPLLSVYVVQQLSPFTFPPIPPHPSYPHPIPPSLDTSTTTPTKS